MPTPPAPAAPVSATPAPAPAAPAPAAPAPAAPALRLVPACLLILGLQLAGEVVSRGLGLPVPGPVLGMAALLAAFRLIPRVEALVRPVAQVLLANLSLLFVPAGVGIVAHLPLLRAEGPALAVALIASTAAAIGVGALTFAAVARATGSAE